MQIRYLINGGLLIVSFALLQAALSAGAISNYLITILTLCGINIILAISLNVATGYLGQLPLGHAGFMAVGAYAGGIFLKAVPMAESAGLARTGLIAAAILVGGLVAAIFGILIGMPALRLKGDYLAIITLGFGEIIRVIIQNIDKVVGFELTGGTSGLKRIPKFTSVMVVFVCVALTCIVIHMLMKSRHGRAILSIRENEIAAESCGINTTYYKAMAFTVSAFFAGVAGALYAGYVGMLQPTNFGFMKSIEILVMVVLGGMGSMIGSILSASVLTTLPQLLLAFDKYRMVVYSLVLIIVMIFKPTGLMGTYDFSLSRILEKLFFRKPKQAAAGHKEGEAQ